MSVPSNLQVAAVVVAALAVVVLTVVDIVRRPPYASVLNAWCKLSPARAAALGVFFLVVLLGMLLPGG